PAQHELLVVSLDRLQLAQLPGCDGAGQLRQAQRARLFRLRRASSLQFEFPLRSAAQRKQADRGMVAVGHRDVAIRQSDKYYSSGCWSERTGLSTGQCFWRLAGIDSTSGR